jgi:transposase InsO family protein
MENRLATAKMPIIGHFSMDLTLRILNVPSSSYYKNIKLIPVRPIKLAPFNRRGRPRQKYCQLINHHLILETSVIELLKEFRKKDEFSNAGGCRAIPHYLRRDNGIIINHKRVYRICKEHKLLLPKNKKNKFKQKKICINRKITGPNQLWQFDIKSDLIQGENRTFYLMSIIDVFTKEIVGYHIGLNCKSIHLQNCFELAFQKLSDKEKCNLTIRSDNGPQMTSNQFTKYIKEKVINQEFIPPGNPNKNAFIESFFSIFETEFIQVHYFENFTEVYKKVVWYINYYNTKRLHGSLKYLTPLDYKNRFSPLEKTIYA